MEIRWASERTFSDLSVLTDATWEPKMARTQDQIALDIVKRFDTVIGTRGPLEAHLEQVAARFWPDYTGVFQSHGMNRTPGAIRTEEMVDATGALALTRFAAAMESMLTPRNSIWHNLVPSDKILERNRSVRLWFENARDLLFKYRYAPKANYQSQKHEDYLALGCFGTGCIFTDRLEGKFERGLRYRAVHLGEIYFMENHQGLIDTGMRKFELTARQAIQQFGKDVVSEKILTAYGIPTKQDDKFWFIHCVKPRDEEDGYDPGRLDWQGMQYGSYYVDVDQKKVVKEEGYHTFPYSISRYVIAPGEVYGRSPAMMALPSQKTLNEMKKTVLTHGHRQIAPVLLAHDDGVLDSFSMKSGVVNFGGVSADGKLLVHALPVGDLAIAKDMMEAEAAVINDFFLVTLFQILVEHPAMTATEVLERAREKGALLSPTMGRQQSESLGPQIERELDVLQQQKLLPPMPPMLVEARGEYTITYDSPLSRMAKAESAAGTMRTVQWAGEIFNLTQDPSIWDPFNFDAIIPDLGEANAMPFSHLATDDEKQAKREARARAAQTKMMVDAAPSLAAVAGKLGAPVG
jgi:hypothetical protein